MESDAQTGGSGAALSSTNPAGLASSPALAPSPPNGSRASTPTTSAALVVLDDQSENWFTTYCLAAAEVSLSAGTAPAGGTLPELQASVAAIYSDVAISASTSVGLLQTTPAPTVDGGDDLQVFALEYFSFLSDVYGRGAVTITGLALTAESDLQAAVQAIEQEAAASAPTPMTGLDPAVLAAARVLPQCQGVL